MIKPTDKNRLSIVRPDLCKEWDYEKNYPLIPEDFCCNARKRVWWKNKNGKEWQSTIVNRNKAKLEPNKLDPNKSLAFKYPKLIKEWHSTKNGKLTPYKISYGSGKKVWWKCKDGHEWEREICARTIGGATCPYCSGHRVSDKNRFSLMFPQLLKEWDFNKNSVDPHMIPVCSTYKALWKCKNGHSYPALVYSRTKNGSGCPYCSNQKVDKSNCIAKTHPNLIKNWHPTKNGKLTPYNLVIGSEKVIHWICDNGHEYEAKPSDKKSNYSRKDRKKYKRHNRGECPYCNGVKVCKETCLATVNPALAKEWHPTKNSLTPDDVFPNTSKIFWWKGKCGHEWPSSVNNRNQGNGCPICSKILLLDGTVWDSYTEAYVYLKFKKRSFAIEPHKKYGLGKSKCDFYLSKFNLYCEITSFNKTDCPNFTDFWKIYKKKIKQKEKFVINKLKAKFRFIQIKKLNKVQKLQVVRKMKK